MRSVAVVPDAHALASDPHHLPERCTQPRHLIRITQAHLHTPAVVAPRMHHAGGTGRYSPWFWRDRLSRWCCARTVRGWRSRSHPAS
jgi:hypothetical protein